MIFKPYPKYTSCAIQWFNEIPQSWKQVRVEQYLIKKDENIGDLWSSTQLLSLTQKGIIEKDINEGKGKTHSDYSTYQAIDIGDLVFCLFDIDETPRTVGLSTKKGMITSAYTAFKSKENINTQYVYYFFESLDDAKALKPYYKGLRKTVRPPEFLKIHVPFPPKVEQVAISQFLDTETTRIDNLIAKQEKLIGLFKENIIMLAMLEQMQGAGELVRLSSVVSEVYRPVHLNNAIEYTALGIYNRGRGLFHKPLTLGCDMGDSSFFYINCGDLILSGQFAWEGAVAMATNAEDGCVVSHRYPVLRGNLVSTEYLLALFMSDYGTYLLNDCSRGSAGRNRPLNINMLLKQKIRIPSDKTQQEIKKLLLEKSILEINVNKTIEKLKEYRASIISHAVTGKIDVREFGT